MSNAAIDTPNTTLKDYDDVLYPGNAVPHSHPSHIATVARLCGITPPNPSSCRVLELGCSVGSNLIPMAESLPGSTFVGVDFSARQIQRGQETVEDLQLDNIELKHLNIADIDESFGEFDYIICHGVYSWVPSDIQEKILAIGKSHLRSNGIMFVSYNTYPGWHLREAIRDMMRYHVEQFETPSEKVSQARQLLEFLAESVKTRFEAYPKLLEQEVESLRERTDSYIYHEFLEANNEPVYFHQFVERVSASGLRYVADAEIRTMLAQAFEENVSKLLKNVSMLRREQYMDFLRSRMFRVSLLCKQEMSPKYDISADCLLPLHACLTSPLTPEQQENGRTKWSNTKGSMVTTSPMTEVIEMLNSGWPGWVSVKELVEGPLKGEESKQLTILRELMQSALHGVIRFAEQPPAVHPRVSDSPRCSPYVRWQAKQGDSLTSRRHADLKCERLTRLIAEHADGQRTVSELTEIVSQAAESGDFKITLKGDELDAAKSIDWLPVVQQELARLASSGLLVE